MKNESGTNIYTEECPGQNFKNNINHKAFSPSSLYQAIYTSTKPWVVTQLAKMSSKTEPLLFDLSEPCS